MYFSRADMMGQAELLDSMTPAYYADDGSIGRTGKHVFSTRRICDATFRTFKEVAENTSTVGNFAVFTFWADDIPYSEPELDATLADSHAAAAICNDLLPEEVEYIAFVPDSALKCSGMRENMDKLGIRVLHKVPSENEGFRTRGTLETELSLEEVLNGFASANAPISAKKQLVRVSGMSEDALAEEISHEQLRAEDHLMMLVLAMFGKRDKPNIALETARALSLGNLELPVSDDYDAEWIGKGEVPGMSGHYGLSTYLDFTPLMPNGFLDAYKQAEKNLWDVKSIWERRFSMAGLSPNFSFENEKALADFVTAGKSLGIDTLVNARMSGVSMDDLPLGK